MDVVCNMWYIYPSFIETRENGALLFVWWFWCVKYAKCENGSDQHGENVLYSFYFVKLLNFYIKLLSSPPGRSYSGISRREVNTNGLQGVVGVRGRLGDQYRGRVRRVQKNCRERTRGTEQQMITSWAAVCSPLSILFQCIQSAPICIYCYTPL